MPTRFAVKTGFWSDVTTWDNSIGPVAGDTVHPNGFTVTIDQDINVDGLNNNISPVYLPNMAIPKMTSNTQPSGICDSSTSAGGFPAYYAFDQTTTTYWQPTTAASWASYEFPSPKLIKRYYIKGDGTNFANSWNFEGWNGTSWDILEGKTGSGTPFALGYVSPILPHSTFYAKYRINILTTNASLAVKLFTFEMSESTNVSPVYGTGSGGSFTVPSSLSGIRNIVQTGAGIISNNSASVITLAHTSGNTVNFNTTSGGYIFNPNNHSVVGTEFAIISINGTGIINFNGDIYGTQISGIYNRQGTILINANATVTINGNIYLSKGHSSTPNYTINLAANNSNGAILNINGNIIASNLYLTSYIFINSNATINITGILTSDLGTCLATTFDAASSIISAIITITGIVNMTNSNSVPAIYFNSRSLSLTINGSIINKGNTSAIYSQKIRFTANTSPYWTFQNSAAADITLSYGTPATGPYPAEADVRYNTAYGASPTRYGTLRVPLPQYVSQGVLTDNTVGTAYLSATDVWNVLTSNITTAGSIGERLKNASTVQTNGDQLAAYIV